jgi:hypothetical protein
MKFARQTISFSLTVSILAASALSLTPALGQRSIVICHGEFEFKCKAHPYDIFEHCGDDNGIGGANPSATGQKLCGTSNYLGADRSEGGGIGGNHCGYS